MNCINLHCLKQKGQLLISPLFRRYLAVIMVFVLISLAPAAYALKGRKFDAVRVKAKKGDVLAQFELGNQYFFGTKRRTRNYTVAALWYRRAALQGHAAAQFNLAICYDRGLGLKKSRFEAFRWYKRAAAGGIKEAKLNLALCYAYGIPPDRKAKVPTPPVYPNFAQAKKLLLGLGQEGFFPAVRELGALYLDKKSETLKILQQLRNEAHRFGINHHRNKRSKSAIQTELSGIDGIGEKTILKLLKKYKSVKRIRELSLDELVQLINKDKAHKVFNYFASLK